ncbi:hypothetical protein ISN44_As12g031100 [Arabidopsis suecica]|uniref:Uncharacterized protein n=1 Tax=Arabidopsis suecica TaxID=45249 RepID=A0A8T1YNT9_ARASU|nr:hypothetical protein ISN44_As12g031100 [Arabidopsis suecica]
MTYIPAAVMTDIVRRIGRDGFRNLGPLIAARPFFQEFVFSREVLVDVDLDEFLANTRLGREESIYRPFPLRCATEGHEIARYIEALCRLTQEGPSVEALEMLGEVGYSYISATFAFAVMLLCCGSYEQGMVVTRTFFSRIQTLEEAVAVAEVVEDQIRHIGPGHRNVFYGYIHFKEYPICYFAHTNSSSSICQNCFAFNYATRVHEMC